MGDSVGASDSLVLERVETSRDASVGAWWFETVIAGTEWDPVLFTKILNDCRPKLHQTLAKSSIFSYACREHGTIIVPAGQVAIEGFLKMRGSDKVRLGTLQRCLQHDSIIGDINWIPIEVGRTKRYTAHERIQKFLQQTALPPAGVLQSSGSVGPRLRADFLASSDTPLDVGGRPTNRPRDAAAAAGAALGGSTGGNLFAPAGGGGSAAPAAVAAADAAGKGIGMAKRRRRLRAVCGLLGTNDATPPPPSPPPVACPAAFLAAGAAGGGIATAAVAGGAAGADDAASTEAAARAAGAAAPIMR